MVPRPAPQSPTLPLIPEFFAGKEVFITGATGFMGKVLVERLLWTCPEVSRLHLLLRRKRDVLPEKRLIELKQSHVFDVIREHCPERLEKLSMVLGDITKPKFGMAEEGLQQLNKVSVVFHSAATLKFDEHLACAVEQNLSSVLTIMDICDQLPMVKVFVYVSTAYSNAELNSIEERVYPAPGDIQQLLALCDNLPQHILTEVTPKLISPKPNTYTYTKAMAESAVADRANTSRYATAIFRPSIVVSSLQHPFPGWIENLNGPSGPLVGAGKGLLHVLNCAGYKRADMMPVDIVIDTLIAIAWETAIQDDRETRVYNCSSYENPITWAEFQNSVLEGVRNHPFDSPLWYPSMILIKNKLVLNLVEYMFQYVPLHITNFLFTAFGKKQRVKMSTACSRLRAMNGALEFFMMREWQFSTHNVTQLRNKLSAADNAVYNLDPRTINWEDHSSNFVKGTRKYLLGESDQDLEKARSRMRILYVIHRATQSLLIYLMCRLAIRSTPAILQIISATLALRKTSINLKYKK